jgi:hypothetical protein
MTQDACPECGTAKHPLLPCPECGFTHRLAAQSAIPDTIDATPAGAWQPPTIADHARAISALVIRHMTLDPAVDRFVLHVRSWQP